MKLGIVGLPNVGKSTLFNAITNAGAEVANYAFCTIEPNVGVVAVPDYRLDELAKMYSPKKITPAVIEFVDIAGLVKGASKGEGLGNKFLSHIREVDAVIHVVRCFDNDDIMHVSGSVDPKRDIETINLELILSDLEILDRRIDRTAKAAKGDKSLLTELEFLKRLKTELENGVSARAVEADDDEKAILADIGLLSAKPVIYACNMSEDDFASNIENNERYKAVCEIAKAEGAEVLPICAEFEAEISSLSKEEKEMFLSDAGIESGGLDMLIQRSYSLLGLISYLTAGEPEVRAWTIKKGTKAPQAAQDYMEGEIDLNDILVRHREATFYVRISGDSMQDAGILDGDLAVVDRQIEPSCGNFVIAFVDGEFTIKQFKMDESGTFGWLIPWNRNFSPIRVDETNRFMIWGVVTYVIHQIAE